MGAVDNYTPDPENMRLGREGAIEYLFTMSRPAEGCRIVKHMWSPDWESAEKAAPGGWTVDGIVYAQGEL